MKLASCETHVVAVAYPHIGGMYWIFVTLKTDDDIEGIGEVYAASFHPTVVKAAVADVHDRLRSYTYLYPKNAAGEYDYENIELSVECALECMEQGFSAVKFDPAGPYTVYSGHQLSLEEMERCETFCRRIREGEGGPTHPHSGGRRRAADDEIRIRRSAGTRRGVDPTDEPWPRWWDPRRQEGRGHCRNLLRPDRTAPL